MAWGWVQSNSAVTAGKVTSLAVAFTTANVQAGTKLRVYLSGDNLASVTSVKDGAGNSFTQVVAPAHGGTGTGLTAIFELDTPAGDVGTKPTITAVFPTSDLAMLIQEVSGLVTGASNDGTPGTSAGTGTGNLTSPTYSSTAANEYLTYVYGDDGPGANTLTLPAGYTADPNNINGSSASNVSVAYKNSTGGAETGTWNLSVSADYALILVAGKLSGAAPANLIPQQERIRVPVMGQTSRKVLAYYGR